ncbi:polysaccharide pyruvyl transferase family protein [Heyndrickxia acidicola]|uniref:Polysaccharide pyruvyl transferase family protein n=1 Tax=Heyndrickxia acidicola TaxID=209389 RepID=A0ABU6ML45_9BACI|nr:polysaccharide pyruvyl transferase family protein [Heyndrickxia acidicola]MED1205209.1 polysaccharide pyruvyl transferase family protein [Heyndrickxia acidicola]
MKKRILVWAYFSVNIGDDLFLKTLFDRYPEVKWDLLTANRNYKKVFRNYKNVNILYSYRGVFWGEREVNLFIKMNDVLLKYKKYEALVLIGGSIFKQNKGWENRYKERRNILHSFSKLNKKVFIISANFGPYEDYCFMKKYDLLFSQCYDICFRDSYSYTLFKHLKNVRLAPDAVLSLEVKKAQVKEKCVGLSLINLEKREELKAYNHAYNKKMVDLMNEYIAEGYKIKLFSFCQYEGDLKACQQILAKFPQEDQNMIRIINYDGQIDPFLEEYKTCELIIGARFHSIILAFLFNQNVYPIIYSDKTYHTLVDLKMDKNCIFIKDIHKLESKKVFQAACLNKVDQNILLQAHRHFEELDQFLFLFKSSSINK